ncbi:hypothetical protein CLV92_1212 [Kineococcus xinjiangensis]|uniref:Uncharacterized protein n=1 Tax=Kineococcus xinjiangensis TaxID=512762 RepID=A0A2S6IC95_9ACTN|nr:hypothetical protein [Kineococcus xinjiangensis]PPK90872.1 hypothetical protein CLV92_1212 [Kineococcus xinjiangensis]
MNISGASTTNAAWGVSATSSTSRASASSADGGDDTLARLKESDWQLIEHATGWTRPADFDPRHPDGPVPLLAGTIAMSRGTDQLGTNQEITGAWLKAQAMRYQQAAIADHPFSGAVMERALAYLDSKGRGTDLNL